MGRESVGQCNRASERRGRVKLFRVGFVLEVHRLLYHGLLVIKEYRAHAAVGGEDDDGRERRLERAVQVREALQIQHVHLLCRGEVLKPPR